jgi:hypothetical protein
MVLERRQVNLTVEDIPRQWYNLVADLPAGMEMPPPIDPDEGPSRLKQLPKFLVGECLKQEMTGEKWIDIRGDPGIISADRKTQAVVQGEAPGRSIEDSGEALLERGAFQPDRQPQGKHRYRAGVLCEKTGIRTHNHRNRRGPVVIGACPGSQPE